MSSTRAHERLPPSAETALARAAGTVLPADACEHAARLLPRLHEVRAALDDAAWRWVAIACEAKGIAVDSPLAAEEFATGPCAVARSLACWERSLRAVRAGRLPRIPGRVREHPRGRLVPAMPFLPFDRVAFAGHRAAVLVDREGPLQALRDARRGVALVLGAGNVTSIPIADLLTKLCGERLPVVVKLHPLHAGLHELFASVFAPLAEFGCSFLCEGGELGAALALDPRVTDVHLTGSPATFRRLAEANAARAEPARLSAELGNVTPVIVVPGPWRDAELHARVDDVSAMLSNNGGFNCASAKVLVTAAAWPQRREFLARLRARLATLPARRAWHPGAVERAARFAGLAARDDGSLPCTLIEGVDPASTPLAFREEAFAPLLWETALPGDDVAGFAGRAARFCNERLAGDLAAVILAPRHAVRHERFALAGLRDALGYGTVAQNVWAALGFAWMTTPWGAWRDPAGGLAQSGRGFVHDPLLLRAPQKTLITGPVLPWPRPAWWPGHRAPLPVMRRLFELTQHPSAWRLLRLALAASVGGTPGR